MKTHYSFTFQARRYVAPQAEQYLSTGSNFTGPWIMSAGRWSSHGEAVAMAAAWLVRQAEEDPQQYELAIVQVEELELTNEQA